MNAVAANPAAQMLRVLIAVADAGRAAVLTQVLRALGHFVVRTAGEASVALTDGAIAFGNLPVVTLAAPGPTAQGRLSRDATFEQIDAALRAVAAGLQVEMAVRGGALKRSMTPSSTSCSRLAKPRFYIGFQKACPTRKSPASLESRCTP